MHIGSQITDLAPFRDAFRLHARARARAARATATRSTTSTSAAASACPTAAANDVPPHPPTTPRVVKRGARRSRPQARARAGPHDRRQRRHPRHARHLRQGGRDKTFTIVDAAMNDLIRPTLYEAHHDIWPVAEAQGARCRRSCRTSSGRSARPATTWRSTARCRRFEPGDLIAVMTAGAYGAVMSSTYNTRLLVPEVLVNGDALRRRPPAPDLRRPDRRSTACRPGSTERALLCRIRRLAMTAVLSQLNWSS